MGRARAFAGDFDTYINGVKFTRPTWIGCPGDWPAYKAELANPGEWSTARFGTQLLAMGPASGPGMVVVTAALAALGLPDDGGQDCVPTLCDDDTTA